MDVYEAVKNPTGGNIANAAISVGADIFGYRLLKNAGKGYKALKAARKAKADDLIRRGFGKDYAKRATEMHFFGDDKYANYLSTQLAVQGGDKVINLFQNKVAKERQEKKVGYARKSNAKK
jgi:phospholipase/lecithinase/hemolysin